MSDLKPRRCDEHDFQCYRCGVAAEVGVNIAVTRAEPLPPEGDPVFMAHVKRGQLALELLRKIANDYYLTLDDIILGEIEAVLLEASDG